MPSVSTLSMVKVKCTYFIYKLTYIAMAVYVFPSIPLLSGSLVTRSILMICHGPSGTVIGSVAGLG